MRSASVAVMVVASTDDLLSRVTFHLFIFIFTAVLGTLEIVVATEFSPSDSESDDDR